MSSSHEPSAQPDEILGTLTVRFREHYERTARFREDRELAEALTQAAWPVLDALASDHAAAPARTQPHDAYAMLSMLCRRAATLGATASVAITLPDAIAHALCAGGVELEPALRGELAIVAVEAYTAEREERITRDLQRRAAESQVALKLAPRCLAIVLSGSHDEADLGPVLERFARELLRDDVKGCLLDVTRLSPIEEELARALGRFCAQAATLGVQIALVTGSATLRAQLQSWLPSEPLLGFFDEYDRAQAAALAAAGREVRTLRRWARLFLPAGSGLVR